MTIDGNQIKLEASSSGSENITDIQNYLDSFNKEIEGNDVTQVTTGMYNFALFLTNTVTDLGRYNKCIFTFKY